MPIIAALMLWEIFLIILLPVSGNNCTTEDIAIWKDNAVFSSRFASAAQRSVGVRSVATRMFEQWYPTMTLSCIDCHVDSIKCGVKHCIVACTNPKSSACTRCIHTWCIPKYKLCIGCSDQDLPLPPTEWT